MGLPAAIFYGICSGSMAFINKIAITTYGFKYPNFLLLVQMVFTVAVLWLLKVCRRVDIPNYTYESGMNCLLPSLFYSFHATFALSALGVMNIPMYNVMKRCVPLVTVFLGMILLNKGRPRWQTIASVSVITSGCIVAGYGDLDFKPEAYTSGLICIVSQGMYLTMVQKLGLEKQYSALGILYFNSINCIPLLTMYNISTSEYKGALNYLNTASPGFVFVFIPVISMGCVLNYSLFLCTTSNSALTTSIVGIAKSVITTIVGMFTFGGIQMNALNLIGILMNTIGGIWYTSVKYQENNKAAETGKAEEKEKKTPIDKVKHTV